MKIESLPIDKLPDGRELNVTYRRLGQEAFLVNESILITFYETALGKEPGIYFVTTQRQDYEGLDKIIKALQRL